jgi:RNA polymerase sigma factor (sigma-70 family)
MPPLQRAVQQLRRLARPPRPDPAADRQLLAAFAQRRDEAAFAELVRRHGSLVRGVCRRVLGDGGDADDAFQAAFLLLARKAGAIGWGASLAGWLHATAWHLAHKARRAAERRRRHEACAPSQLPMTDPATAAAWRELGRVLDEELTRLPERLRAPLVLCYLEGQTRDEAARHLGWSLSTFKRRLARGRLLLRSRLERRGVALALAGLPAALAEAPVSAALTATTVEAAVAFLSGTAIPVTVAALIEGTGPPLGVKAAVALGLVLTAGVLAAGLIGVEAPAGPQAPPAPPPAAQRGQPDDPLPAGALARLGTVAFRHGTIVRQVLATPDGRTVFSLSHDAIRVWRADSGREDGTIAPPEQTRFVGCSLLPDGNALAVSYFDGSIHLWDWRTRQELRTLDVSLPQVGGSMFAGYVHAPDGRSIAALDDDEGVTVVDLVAGKKTLKLDRPHGGATAVAFAPDGQSLLAACKDKSVRAWDLAAGKEVRTYTGLTDAVKTLALSPDGRWLATVGAQVQQPDGTIRTMLAEKVIRVWDLTTSREVHRLDGGAYGAACLVFAPDSRSLVAGLWGCDGRIVRQWDVTTGQKVREFPGHGNAVLALAFAPDGKTLVTADSVIHLWDWTTGRERLEPAGHQGAVWGAAFLPDGRTLLTAGNDNTLRFWDPARGRELRRFAEPQGSMRGFALSPDGRTFATTSGQSDAYRLSVWETATGRPIRELRSTPKNLYQPAFSPDGRTLAVADYGDNAVRLWDTGTWQERRAVPVPQPSSLSFTQDGRTLLGVSESTSFAIDTAAGKLDLRFPAGQNDHTYCHVYSADGKILASGGEKGLPGGGVPAFGDRGVIRLYDVATGQELRELSVRGGISTLTFSPDGRLLASGGWASDSSVAVWDVVTGKRLREFTGHRGRVLALTFSPDGRRLVSGGEDTTALVWDVSE